MRSSAPLAGLLLALAACGDDDPPALPETAAACPITEPVRLAAAPAGFTPAADVWYGLHVLGDHILYTFNKLDSPNRVYWHFDRCTGEIEPYPSLAPGLHNPYTIDTPAGQVLYANDAIGGKYIVDRLDDPGADEPTSVPGLPEQTGLKFPGVYPRPYTSFSSWNDDGSDTNVYNAAGLGGRTYAFYTHDGDRDAPALRLADDIVAVAALNEDLLLHHDSGELRRVDPLTGAGETLLDGVRHFQLMAGKIVWQAIGDDIAEPVYLHDLDAEDTADDLLIATNDFAQLSWSRDPEDSSLGGWAVTQDGAAIALEGPDGLIVVAVAVDTGDSLNIPAHTGLHGSIGAEFDLVLPDDIDHVEALWNPLTGTIRVWYRGPDLEPELHAVDGDLAEYFVPDTGNTDTGSLWRVDLGTGKTTKVLARSSTFALKLDDTHYFLGLYTGQLPGPPYTGSAYSSPSTHDLKLVDAATGLYTPIADTISDFAIIPDEGLIYLDAHGPEPGIWAYPLPFPG